jgi:nucleoid-associated protein YgaU
MSQQLGPTYFLSVLVVIGCAITFYRAEKPAYSPSPPVARAQREETIVEPDVGSGNHRPEPDSARLVAGAGTSTPRRESTPVTSAEPRRAQVTAPVMRPVLRRQSVTRGAFARTEEGDTLEDVALRVYGTPGRAEALWKANRDQLTNPGAALAGGMLLRTP